VSDAFTTSVRIDAPPEEVFPYLTDARLIIRWMGDWAELDPTPGGKLVVDIRGVPIRGEFLEVDPPRRLVFSWGAAGSDVLPPGSTRVEILLYPDGTGTLVELTHHDLPPEERPLHATGWRHFLERLVLASAGRDPGPDPWATT
jgi:uncharacterized protein YndB with AHSA1/START domain